jgi:hypothetical protein
MLKLLEVAQASVSLLHLFMAVDSIFYVFLLPKAKMKKKNHV